MEHTAADAVIGILSIASLSHGVTAVHAGRLMDRLNEMHPEYPSVVPEIPSRDLWMKFLYYDLVKGPAHFPLGKDQWTMELSVERALRNLVDLHGRLGEGFVRSLGPAAHMFSQLLRRDEKR